MEKEIIQLTKEEEAIISVNREQAEKVKACSDEVNAVLNKYGMTLQIISNPQIAVVPVRPNA